DQHSRRCPPSPPLQPSVREPDSEREETLRRLVVVEVLRRVAEPEDVATDMEIPASVRARHLADGNGDQHADIEEPEAVVFTGYRVLVVVVQAQTQLDRNRHRELSSTQSPARTRETELEIGPLVWSAVGTA